MPGGQRRRRYGVTGWSRGPNSTAGPTVWPELLDHGLGPQDKVANYLFNCPEYMEAFFGVVKAGLVPVNTNYRYAAGELAYLWQNADAVAVVFDNAFVDNVDAVRSAVPGVRLWLWVDDGRGWCRRGAAAPRTSS